MFLSLTSLKPFAKGGNRLCFVHPELPAKCIKVRRPDFTLEQLRASKGFPKNLRSLASFDDNREEFEVITQLGNRFGEKVFQHISRCYGFIETDLGKGLVLELIRDADQRISTSAKQYLIEQGLTPSFQEALTRLCDFWVTHAVPSRNLLLHNIVVQRDSDGQVARLVVIDGLGSSSLIPVQWLPVWAQRKKATRKVQNLQSRMAVLLEKISLGKDLGKVGFLLHDGVINAGDRRR